MFLVFTYDAQERLNFIIWPIKSPTRIILNYTNTMNIMYTCGK